MTAERINRILKFLRFSVALNIVTLAAVGYVFWYLTKVVDEAKKQRKQGIEETLKNRQVILERYHTDFK